MPGLVTHTIEPFFDAHSRILILGTMPSPASRREGFYYAHPQNRFWRVLSEVFGTPAPLTIEAKKAFLRARRIALWDVLSSCSIQGADDASIRNAKPNPIRLVLERAPIRSVYTTGKKAAALYQRLCYPDTGIRAYSLPSTSPANRARYTYEQLVDEYRALLSDSGDMQ